MVEGFNVVFSIRGAMFLFKSDSILSLVIIEINFYFRWRVGLWYIVEHFFCRYSVDFGIFSSFWKISGVKSCVYSNVGSSTVI